MKDKLVIKYGKIATKLTKESYNRIFNSYLKKSRDKESRKNIEKLLRIFISYLKKGSLVLDVGCGPGWDVKFMQKNGINAMGIDYSENMIKLAKKRVPDTKFIKMDMRKLKFKENIFDGIWSMASILHIPKRETRKVLLEFNRVLKPNGVLFIGTGEGNGEFISEMQYGVPRFFSFYNRKELESLVKSTGFEILKFMIVKAETGGLKGGTFLDIFAMVKK